MTSNRLPPIGFWSYARGDDEASRGRLSGLRSILMAELQQHYGREPIKLFQDIAAIAPGAEWESEIVNALSRATFFIPIITPAFLESEFCCREVTLFLEREQEIWRDFPVMRGRRRIFPICYRPVDHVEPVDPQVLAALKRLQWVDFDRLRAKPDTDEAVQTTLDSLAASICDVLQIRIGEPAIAPAAARDDQVSPPSAVSQRAYPDPGVADSATLAREKWGGVTRYAALLLLAIVGVGVGSAWLLRSTDGGRAGVAAAPVGVAADGPTNIAQPVAPAPSVEIATPREARAGGDRAAPKPQPTIKAKTPQVSGGEKSAKDASGAKSDAVAVAADETADPDADLWKATRDCAGIAEYLRKYPSGKYAEAARAKQLSCT